MGVTSIAIAPAPPTVVSDVERWAAQVGKDLAAVPSTLEQAAGTGDFGAALTQAVRALDEGPFGASTSATATGTRAGAQTAPAAAGAGASPMLARFSPALPGATRSLGEAVVADAARFVGVPYVWGGESPAGFDCSGLVQYVYGQLGVSLPRTSEEQALVGQRVPSLATAQPGDLVFYAGSDGTAAAPGHVGIYIGNGKMIDAPYTGTTVQVDTVGTPVEIRRVLPAGQALGASGLGALARAAGAYAGTAAGTLGAPTVPAGLVPLFDAAGARYGVSPTLLAAVARQESGFDPHALSSAGAQGLMQLMPGTAASLGVTPFTASQAIDGAARLLSGYLGTWGSVPLALAAYNAGPGAVEAYGGVPPYPQTQAYVSSILQAVGA